MQKPRSKKELKFPYFFEKNGRKGRIKFWPKSGNFGTYFLYGGQKRRNQFATFEGAYEFLDKEFSKLDSDALNSQTLYPVRHDVKTYHELENILREQGNGATLKEAVEFFLAHHTHKRFNPQSVSKCIIQFIAAEKARNLSGSHLTTLNRHLGRFAEDFGSRPIHELTAVEIGEWLASRTHKTDKDGDAPKPWSIKTRRNVRGSLVSLSTYSQSILKAIPDLGRTEFQKLQNPKKDAAAGVEIYDVSQLTKLLLTALEFDARLIPSVVIGCFAGLRPDEFHGENVSRPCLHWDAFNLNDNLLHISGQKVRSKATRDIPLSPALLAWIKPFIRETGPIWSFSKSYTKKIKGLCEKAEVPRFQNGFRHSYASYRIRILKNDLATLAQEMGNSPGEITNSYKRNVTDARAREWFAVLPPKTYIQQVEKGLLRQSI